MGDTPRAGVSHLVAAKLQQLQPTRVELQSRADGIGTA
jgi:hypothetical protein